MARNRRVKLKTCPFDASDKERETGQRDLKSFPPRFHSLTGDTQGSVAGYRN